MATVTRLVGSERFRLIPFRSSDICKLLRITFAEGESVPEGDLVAVASSGGNEVTLFAEEVGGSGPAVVEVTLLAEDFDPYPNNRTWLFNVFVEDSGSGSGDEAQYILFNGTIIFTFVPPRVIVSTRISGCEGSGS
jgi:hypothetical protein